MDTQPTVVATGTGSQDVVRYIQLPQNGSRAGTYLNDSQFLIPTGMEENIEWLRSLADEFNATYAKGDVPDLTAPPHNKRDSKKNNKTGANAFAPVFL